MIYRGSPSPIGLFHIKGTTAKNTIAIQTVKVAASELNSADSFVLVNDQTAYAWNGNGASESEIQVS